MAFGKAVRRVEDPRLLRGQGRYVDDLAPGDALHAVFLRADEPHAEIGAIETAAAAALPGVRAVLTGADWAATGARVVGGPEGGGEGGGGDCPCLWDLDSVGGLPGAGRDRPVFARDRVRHQGEILAMIVAESQSQAYDALEAVAVELTALPAAVTLERAVAAAAPRVHPALPDNRVFRYELGDRAATEAAFAAADRVSEIALVNNRLSHVPLEPRAVVGAYDPGEARYTLWTASQAPHLIRHCLAQGSLKVPAHRIRVISPDVGGGFGLKTYHYPEEAALLWAARRLGSAVRWTAGRGEAFLGDVHARDNLTRARLALDAEGRFLALTVETEANLGAYLSSFGPGIPTVYSLPLLAQQYRIPALHGVVTGYYSHSLPVDAYRGAGRAECAYLVERLVEQAAREAGLEPLALRSGNLIGPAAFPHVTALGTRYDSGDYPQLAATLEDTVDIAGRRATQAALRREGRYRGLGFAGFVESAGVGPSGGGIEKGAKLGTWEFAALKALDDGTLELAVGSHSHGQGHATVFRQLLAARFGCALDAVRVVFGDTDRVREGAGTFGSRSAAVAGAATDRAAGRVIDKARHLAAHLMAIAPGDVTFEDGLFRHTKGNESLTFAAVAAAAHHGGDFPAGMEPGLEAAVYHQPPDFNFPSGLHMAEVEVDPETGVVRLVAYHAVDDCGRVINPMIVAGQTHGAVAQGVGQALLEGIVYDPDSGQLLTGSLLDYAIPRADDLPFLATRRIEIASPTNPLGVKGAGENGCCAAPAAVINAVLDALAPLGVTALDMPATPQRVWRAIQAAREER